MINCFEQYYNTKTKVYPNGKTFMVISNRSIFNPNKPEEDNTPEYSEDNKQTDNEYDTDIKSEKEPNTELNTERSMIRGKNKIFDISFCNKWDYFLTITIDDNKLNAYDVSKVMKKLSIWLNHNSVRKGLKYLIIPEYHKSGRIHMHGLINDSLKVIESGTYKVKGIDKPISISTIKNKGLLGNIISPVYNIPEWQYGFTTAVPIYGDQGALANYVTKYLTKATTKIFGKYYWSSRNLEREPEIKYCNTAAYQDIEVPEVTVPNTDIKLKYISGLTTIQE